ncbi:MAG: hypothetical protein D6722_23085 [Bacteroidetes bacterium]|nr:MAG: hypothetical protein D6722_23085 [Bacteroidota bacterium]
MATSITEISKFLYEQELRFRTSDDGQALILSFQTKNYQDKDGEKLLLLVIKLEEEGEYIKIFAPQAFSVPADRAPIFLQACAMVQWRTKLIQFEYDNSDGEVRPIIEFPLEDAPITTRQLMRCLQGIVQIVDEYFIVLDRALKEGVIEFADPNRGGDLMSLLDSLPPELLEEALRRREQKGDE